MLHRGRHVSTWLIAFFVTSVSLVSCKTSKPKRPKGRLRHVLKATVFTESAAVRALTAVQGFLWVGTSNGLIRWNIENKTADHLTQEDGLPGNEVLALAGDARNGLWVATSGGVTRYDGKTWRQFANCPLGTDIEALIPSGDGASVWVGGAKGLARYIMGHWSMVKSGTHVTSLLRDPNGQAVWAGTDQGQALYCTPSGCRSESSGQGLRMNRVASLSYSDVGLLALGSNAAGDLLAIRDTKRWHTYKTKPQALLNWAKFAMGKMYLAAAGKLYQMLPKKGDRCPKSNLALVSADRNAPQYCLRRLSIPVPSNVTQVDAAMGMLWLGTQNLGVSRYDGSNYVLYRTSDLVRGTRYLSVACQGPLYCFMANGGAAAFRFDGSQWVPAHQLVGVPDGKVMAFLQGPGRAITALVRDDMGRIQIAIRRNDAWTLRQTHKPIASRRPLTVTAASYDAAGSLWMGVAQVDSSGDLVPFGAFEVTRSGDVIPHRNFQGSGQIDERSLSLPNDLSVMAVQGPNLWIGTSTGLCRVGVGRKLHCFEDSSGLPSVVITDLQPTPGGRLWVATAEGLAKYEGTSFKAVEIDAVDARPRSLAFLAGTLWMGTSEGLVAKSITGDTKVYDDDAGLLETRVNAVVADSRQRLWVLHPSGLTLVSP